MEPISTVSTWDRAVPFSTEIIPQIREPHVRGEESGPSVILRTRLLTDMMAMGSSARNSRFTRAEAHVVKNPKSISRLRILSVGRIDDAFTTISILVNSHGQGSHVILRQSLIHGSYE